MEPSLVPVQLSALMSDNSEGEATIGCTVFIDDRIEEMKDIGEVVDGDELV
jgi:hypothetical protein